MRSGIDRNDKKSVAVVGGAGLVGSEICWQLAKNDYNIIILDFDLERAKSLAEQINTSLESNLVSVIRTDITSKNSVEEAINDIDNSLLNGAKLNAVVNSAYPKNANYGAEFFSVKFQDFCENVNLHLGGFFLVSQKFAEYFKAQGCGVIINIASIYGFMAPRFEIYNNTSMTMPIEYAVIKSSILQLTRYLAKYLMGTGIRANAISPGGIEDGQPSTFIKAYNDQCSGVGMLAPKDVSDTVLFLLSDGAACINGQNIIIDDGFSL